jgi:hypothetical protein
MKKATIVIAAIFMAITASGQVKGVDLDNAVEVKTEDELLNHIEEWLQTPESDYVFFIENAYAVDYKHLISELDRILKANDLDINKPDMEDDLLPSEINGLRDYENLSYYVALGKAEIMRRYFIDDEWTIGITCNYQVRVLILVESQEQLNNPGRDAFGNQGDPTGSPDADNYGTGGGLGDGISFGGLGSRRARGSLPQPNTSGCDVTQLITITVEIQVDRDGNVVNAVVSSATYQNKCIWDVLVKAAKKSKFSVDQSANYRQKGWIRYIIVP